MKCRNALVVVERYIGGPSAGSVEARVYEIQSITRLPNKESKRLVTIRAQREGDTIEVTLSPDADWKGGVYVYVAAFKWDEAGAVYDGLSGPEETPNVNRVLAKLLDGNKTVAAEVIDALEWLTEMAGHAQAHLDTEWRNRGHGRTNGMDYASALEQARAVLAGREEAQDNAQGVMARVMARVAVIGDCVDVKRREILALVTLLKAQDYPFLADVEVLIKASAALGECLNNLEQI